MSRESLTEYADYACPFCYLAHRSLERYREAGNELAVDWHPYDLRSDKRDSNGDLAADIGYPPAVTERIERLQAEYGVETMLTPENVPHVDSLDAQLVSAYVAADHPERWVEFDAATFEALWRDGRDISEREELLALGERVGVGNEELSAVLADERRCSRLFERFADARRDGVTDVPTFVHRGRTETGVLSPEDLARFVGER